MDPLAIAQVSPYPWEDRHEVNTYVGRLSEELAQRGHRVVIVAPSRDEAAVRASRKAIRAGDVLGAPGEIRVLAVGEVLPGVAATGSSRGRPAVPIDVARTVEELLLSTALDICHVHEPFAPSVASVALRHSRALNVGTFHAPAERVVATQVARKLVTLVFGRLDARHAAYPATAELMRRFFPAEYALAAPGAEAPAPAPRAADDPVRLLFVDAEERQALRLFLRALRRLDLSVPWEATVVSAQGPSSTTPMRSELRERVRFTTGGEDEALASADILVAASGGTLPAPALVLRATAAGAIPVVSRLPVYEDLVEEHGLLFEPADVEVLGAQLRRLVGDRDLRRRLRDAAPPARAWSTLADEVEASYVQTVARRHDPTGDPELWERLRTRKLIDVDLHMHTDHSGDCATPVEHLLATAREQGLGAIAVTDHNEVSGAFEAAQKAAEFGVKIIIGEEVKSATQGEVIGLFLQEKIPRGLTLEETVAEIKRQGGLVYVPHPFDRMHAVPDYEHLLKILDDVDAIEVYNPRVAIGSFNEEAERFAAKYQIVRGAGSDSHVAAGLGSVRIRMHDFDGPQEFLESLRHAEITTKSGTLLYVQALKFLETRATPRAARRARRDRRVRRATRKS
ncbi:MAG TPA: PHP domain-containing protein [Baekduia sp.]|uniref:PHP domain-containing protein n=1 Tax=Baekduia sp. TaxID=2600305 RepID=UPI002B5B73A3|nr:PHP domain-containing protein [Baekduia sp.]HMJ36184.1 PHP domain-containing protein [Baekduia sp.]